MLCTTLNDKITSVEMWLKAEKKVNVSTLN